MALGRGNREMAVNWWRQWSDPRTDNPTNHLTNGGCSHLLPAALGLITPSPTLGDACLSPPVSDDDVLLFRDFSDDGSGLFRVFGVDTEVSASYS